MTDNYPPGAAHDSSAPYNEVELEPRDFRCTVWVTCCCTTDINTDEYTLGDNGPSLDMTYPEREDAYKEQHYTLDEMLEELRKYINGELLGDVSEQRKDYLRALLADTKSWEVTHTDVET